MIALLDVNVLIALIDPKHVAHDIASHWFDNARKSGWATCPITENGLIRIISQPRYPNALGSTAEAAALLAKLRTIPNHHFWPDSISVTDAERVDPARLLMSSQVTDAYLLALAAANEGRLATLDRKLSTKAVRGGRAALLLVAG